MNTTFASQKRGHSGTLTLLRRGEESMYLLGGGGKEKVGFVRGVGSLKLVGTEQKNSNKNPRKHKIHQ